MNQPKHLSVTAELEEIRPLYDFVLVRRLDEDGKKDGLVILPDASRNPMKPGVKQGKVIACGAGDKLHDSSRVFMHVKSGDTVLYQRAPANNVVINGGEYVFLHEESQILAVIEA